MIVSELIDILSRIYTEDGDLEILGGFLSDDSGLREVSVLNEHGCDIATDGGDPVGVFFE